MQLGETPSHLTNQSTIVKTAVFRHVTPCCLVETYKCLPGTYCLHKQSSYYQHTSLHGVRSQNTLVLSVV